MSLCPVCGEREREGKLLCRPCSRSYDRQVARDETTYAIILWAAHRARLAERRRGNRLLYDQFKNRRLI